MSVVNSAGARLKALQIRCYVRRTVRSLTLSPRVRHAAVGVLLLGIVAFVVYWIVWRASNAATKEFGWNTLLSTLLDGATRAGLYFLVASGFTLIFGLMRVVNMAHGAFFLLGGYIALELQRRWVGLGDVGLTSDQVSFWREWALPIFVGALLVGASGSSCSRCCCAGTRGRTLRQALITIAVSIIAADLMLEHFGGIAKDIAFPLALDRFEDLHVADVQYSRFRPFILGMAIFVGLALWIWLKFTRTGMIVRAGVDDRQMVQALGINIQITFAIAFFVGSFLAGLGGGMGGSFASLAPGSTASGCSTRWSS